MSFWEQHKNCMVVLAAFFVLLFGVWLFVLRGYAFETATHRRQLEDSEKRREKCCPESGTRVQVLEKMFVTANGKLTVRLAELKQQLHYPFAKADIPAKHLPNRQVYVRNQYDLLCNYVLQELEGKRRFAIDEAANGLGMTIPKETTESLAMDNVWMRQLVSIRRVVDLLLSVHEQEDGTGNIFALHSIKPLLPEQGTDVLNFIGEYPVEIMIHMRLSGLLRLLKTCATPGSFFVVQALDLSANGAERLSKRLTNKAFARQEKRDEYESWYGHYYAVRLVLATAHLSDPAKSEKKKSGAVKGKVKVIPH